MTASEDPAAPSMDAILASIKRIIAEEADVAPPPTLRRVSATPPVDDVLDLTEEATEPFAPGEVEGQARGGKVAPAALGANGSGDTARASLDALSAMVVTADPPGSDTLEGLVRELIRPMLAEWLDAKLPAIVERQVAVEIERITSRN